MMNHTLDDTATHKHPDRSVWVITETNIPRYNNEPIIILRVTICTLKNGNFSSDCISGGIHTTQGNGIIAYTQHFSFTYTSLVLQEIILTTELDQSL